MSLDIIIGTQWGDENIGQMGGYLANQADYVARFNGGDIAGHTISVDRQTFKLNLIPSGVIRPQTSAVLGNGLVINPKDLVGEINSLQEAGIEITPSRLHISHAAHLVTPAYLALAQAREQARGDDGVIIPMNVEPIYEELPGWGREILRVRRWRRLPKEAQRYIKFIEDFAGVPVRLVSVGSESDQIIEVK